jgi:hypothetical protein
MGSDNFTVPAAADADEEDEEEDGCSLDWAGATGKGAASSSPPPPPEENIVKTTTVPIIHAPIMDIYIMFFFFSVIKVWTYF